MSRSHPFSYKCLMYSITEFFGIFHLFLIRKASMEPSWRRSSNVFLPILRSFLQSLKVRISGTRSNTFQHFLTKNMVYIIVYRFDKVCRGFCQRSRMVGSYGYILYLYLIDRRFHMKITLDVLKVAGKLSKKFIIWLAKQLEGGAR